MQWAQVLKEGAVTPAGNSSLEDTAQSQLTNQEWTPYCKEAQKHTKAKLNWHMLWASLAS